jgi:hypothetical protein
VSVARRSYLRRIAEPVPSDVPVLHPAARLPPASEEPRVAPRRLTPPDDEPARDVRSAAPPDLAAPPVEEEPHEAARRPEPAAAADAALEPAREDPTAPVPALAVEREPASAFAPAAGEPSSTPSRLPEFLPAGVTRRATAYHDDASPAPAAVTSAAAPTLAREPAGPRPAPATGVIELAPGRTRSRALPQAPSSASADTSREGAPQAAAPSPDAFVEVPVAQRPTMARASEPNVRVGRIEVRVGERAAQAAPAVPAALAATTAPAPVAPLARGFTRTFGLVQG